MLYDYQKSVRLLETSVSCIHCPSTLIWIPDNSSGDNSSGDNSSADNSSADNSSGQKWKSGQFIRIINLARCANLTQVKYTHKHLRVPRSPTLCILMQHFLFIIYILCMSYVGRFCVCFSYFSTRIRKENNCTHFAFHALRSRAWLRRKQLRTCSHARADLGMHAQNAWSLSRLLLAGTLQAHWDVNWVMGALMWNRSVL